MRVYWRKTLILLTLLSLVSCLEQAADSTKENSNKKSESSGDSLGGTISKVWNNIIPSAHAASAECSSNKSTSSEVYVELYKITDTSKLGTDEESSGLQKLCDTDLVGDVYDFKVDKARLGESPLKIKVVDNRANPVHKDKVIISTAKNNNHDIDKEKTVQSKLIENKIKEDTILANELDFEEIDNMMKRFHEQIIDEIISSNNQEGQEVEDLFKMMEVFTSKIDKIYENVSDHATLDDLGGFDAIPVSEFELSQSEIDALPEVDRCFMEAQSESDFAQCESSLDSHFALLDEVINGFFENSNISDSSTNSEIESAIDNYLSSLDSNTYNEKVKKEARQELLFVTKDRSLIHDHHGDEEDLGDQQSGPSASELADAMEGELIMFLQSDFQILVSDLNSDHIYTGAGEVISESDHSETQVTISMINAYLVQQQVYDFQGGDTSEVAGELGQLFGL